MSEIFGFPGRGSFTLCLIFNSVALSLRTTGAMNLVEIIVDDVCYGRKRFETFDIGYVSNVGKRTPTIAINKMNDTVTEHILRH